MDTQKRQQADNIIRQHVAYAASAALIPVPGADIAAVSAVQLDMLRQVASLYGINFMDAIGRNLITSMVGGSLARIGASLIKTIPVVGTIIGEITMPILSAASTYALGHVIVHHLENGGTLDTIDLKRTRKEYKEAVAKKEENLKKENVNTSTATTDDIISRLKKLSELKDAGILSETEFLNIKMKLLESMS